MALIFGNFVYNLILELNGRPRPIARWARGMTGRQLWLVEGILLAVLGVVAIVIILARFSPR
jgi:hypothetical protein